MLLLLKLISKIAFIQKIIFQTKIFTREKTLQDSLLVSPILAHTLANPISVLISNLEFLLEQNTYNSNKNLKRSYIAALRLKELLAVQKERQLSVFNLKKSLDTSILFFKAKHRCRVLYSSTTSNLKVKGSKHLLEEALLCILNNAAEAYTATIKPSVIVVYAYRQKDSAIIMIQDFGLGMNSLAQKVATISGVTYKSYGFGVGIPFAISVIEESFNGKLEIESKLKKGTRVTITLPLYNAGHNQNP